MPNEYQLNRANHLLNVMAKMIRENKTEEYNKLMASAQWMLDNMADMLTDAANDLKDDNA